MHGYPYRLLLCWITLLALTWLGLCAPWSLAWHIFLACGAASIAAFAWIMASRRLQARLRATSPVRYAMDKALPGLSTDVKQHTPLILLIGSQHRAVDTHGATQDGSALDAVHITEAAIWVTLSDPTQLMHVAVALKAWRDGQGPDGVAYLVAADRTDIGEGHDACDLANTARYTLSTETKRWRHAIQATSRALGYSLPTCVGVFAEQSLPGHDHTSWEWVSTDRSGSEQDAARQSYAHARSHWHALSTWARIHVIPTLTQATAGSPALQLAAFGVTTIGGWPNPASSYRRYVTSITALVPPSRSVVMATPPAAHLQHPDDAHNAFDRGDRPPMPDPLIIGLPMQRVQSVLPRFLCDALIAAAVFFCLAAMASAWQNDVLVQRISHDIGLYQALSVDQDAERLDALTVLKQHRDELENYARTGVPLRLGLGFYQGKRLLPPLKDVIAQYRPPAPAPLPGINAPATALSMTGLSLFNSGSAVLSAGAGRPLIAALNMIQAHPSQRVLISGHADNTGNVQSNVALSQARAAAVRDWLIGASGLPPTHFIIHGAGAIRPLATNATLAGRAANRRVEIVLLPVEEDLSATLSPGADVRPQP